MESTIGKLKLVDFVSTTVKPTINGRNRVSSVLGGILSVIIGIAVSLGFVYFGLDMVTKTNPLMNNIQERTEEAVVPWKSNPFIISAYDKYGRQISGTAEFKRSIQFSAQLGIFRIPVGQPYTIEYFEGPLKLCEPSDMDASIWEAKVALGYDYSLAECLDQTRMVNYKGETYKGEINLINRYLFKVNNFVRFKVKLCDEQADPGCRDYLNKLGYFNLVMYGNNYYEEQSDFENPVKPNFEGISTMVSASYHQTKYIFTKTNKLITDSSVLLSRTKTDTYYSIGSIETGLAVYDPADRTIFQALFSMDQIISKNQRRYIKIPELLANMGGLIKGTMLICQLIAYSYSEFTLFRELSQIIAFNKAKPLNTEIIAGNRDTSSSKINSFGRRAKMNEIGFWKYLCSALNCARSNKTSLSKINCFKYLDFEHILKLLLHVENQMKEQSQTVRYVSEEANN